MNKNRITWNNDYRPCRGLRVEYYLYFVVDDQNVSQFKLLLTSTFVIEFIGFYKIILNTVFNAPSSYVLRF